jgi:hypothetical protein
MPSGWWLTRVIELLDENIDRGRIFAASANTSWIWWLLKASTRPASSGCLLSMATWLLA